MNIEKVKQRIINKDLDFFRYECNQTKEICRLAIILNPNWFRFVKKKNFELSRLAVSLENKNIIFLNNKERYKKEIISLLREKEDNAFFNSLNDRDFVNFIYLYYGGDIKDIKKPSKKVFSFMLSSNKIRWTEIPEKIRTEDFIIKQIKRRSDVFDLLLDREKTEKVCIQYIKRSFYDENILDLSKIPQKFLTEDFALKYLSYSYKFLSFIKDKSKISNYKLERIASRSIDVINFIDSERIALEALKNYGADTFPELYKKDFFISVLKKYFSYLIRNEEFFTKLPYSTNSYGGTELKSFLNDKEVSKKFLEKIVIAFPRLIALVEKENQTSRMILELLSYDMKLLPEVNMSKLKHLNKKMQKELAIKNPVLITFFQNKLDDKDLIEIIQKNSDAFKIIKNPSLEVCLEAITLKKENLFFIPKKILKSKEFQLFLQL